MAKENERKEAKERKRKQDGGLLINPHGKTAHARAHARPPCTCTYAEAGEAAAEIAANCFPQSAKDLPLWAWYCRHFDRRRIVDKAYYYASCQRQNEVRDGVTAFQAWLRKEYGAKGLPAVAGEAAKAGGAA
jgi:hypothetical protein